MRFKVGDIVRTDIEFHNKIHGHHWRVVGKDFSNVGCLCLKHLGEKDKYVCIDVAWVRRPLKAAESRKTTPNKRRDATPKRRSTRT